MPKTQGEIAIATLGSLIISLEANTAKFESAMTKAQYTAKKSSDAIKGTFIALGAAIAGALSISAFESMVKDVANMESALLKMATRLNTNVETLSSFGVMIRKTGMDADTFYTTLTRLEKGISAAASKAEQSTGAFDEEGNEIMKTASAYNELGLNAEILNKMPLDQKLMALAEAFKRNIDPADRVRVAMEIGGKSAAGLVNIFAGGASKIQEWIAEQRSLGIITTENAQKAAEFSNAVKNLDAAWAAFKRNIAEGVIPTLIELIGKINQAIATSREMSENKEFFRQYFPGKQAYPLGQATAGVGPYGAAFGVEPSQYTPMPYVPPAGLTKPPIRPGDITKTGKGGGGGDMGLDRMRSIIDTLQKDLSRLTEGSLAEIREWANHTRNEIEKVGRKGAETEEAMRLVATVEAKKKEKATEDYYLFVAKESGDNYKQIEADAKDWLTKYKGFSDAETNINVIKNRKIWEEDNRQNTERLSLQKSLLESIAQEMPFLSQRLEIAQRVLPLEIELNKLALDRAISSLKLNEAQKDELRGLLAISAAAKKYSLEKAKWAKEGIGGGLKIGAEEIKKSAETFSAETTARLAASMPYEISNLLASSFVGFLQGKTPDLQAIGISMAQSIIQTLLQGILNIIIPSFLEGLAGGLGGILGELGGGGLLSIFGFHQGGIIEAHSGWPLKYDERLIKVQTGERVLSRRQNQEYESGMGGGLGSAVININPRYPMSRQETEHMVRNKLIPAMIKQQKRMGAKNR